MTVYQLDDIAKDVRIALDQNMGSMKAITEQAAANGIEFEGLS